MRYSMAELLGMFMDRAGKDGLTEFDVYTVMGYCNIGYLKARAVISLGLAKGVFRETGRGKYSIYSMGGGSSD